MNLKREKIFWLVIVSTVFYFFQIPAVCQTHLQLILKTDIPVDSAFIVQWNDRRSVRLAFKDTIEVDFKTKGIDYYHLNYKIANGKNYFVALYLDTGNIKIVTHIENEKLIVDNVTGSPIYEEYAQWRVRYNELKSNKDSIGMDAFLLQTYK